MIAEKANPVVKPQNPNPKPLQKPTQDQITHQPLFPPTALAPPVQFTIPNPKSITFQQLVQGLEFSCLSSEVLAVRLGNQFFIATFIEEMKIKLSQNLKFQDIVHSSFGEEIIMLLLREGVVSLRVSGMGEILRSTLMTLLAGEVNKYQFIRTPENNVVFLVTRTNQLEMYRVRDRQMKLVGSVDIKLKEPSFQIIRIFAQRRQTADNYMFVMVSRTYNNGVFDREWLHILQVQSTSTELQCTSFEVLNVRSEGHLHITRFQLWIQEPDNHQFIEVCMNNQILIVCKFIKKYMIWQALYHKKIKEEAKTRNFGLCRNNYFYIIERLHMEIHRFWFVEDKKLKKTTIKTELAHFIPDQMAEIRPMLGYTHTQRDGQPTFVILNCEITPTKITFFARRSVFVDIWVKLDKVITLIDHHKEFEKELDKVINFISAKSGCSNQQVLKQVWMRWPKIPEKNSNSMRKLLLVGEPKYIQKQLILLLQKQRLKVDLIEDILSKCEQLYKKALLKNFTAKLLRQYVKCNFKTKKIRLHMMTCKVKDISYEEYKHLMKLDMDVEIKKYLPEFRKVDLEVALGQFSTHFLRYYSEILCYGFSRIKDIKYFVTNFNFLFPTSSKPQIWELNLDRKEGQITKDKIIRINQQAATKQEPFQQVFLNAQKERKQYMINNDVFSEKKTVISSFKEAYYAFFSALVESTELSGLETIQVLTTLCSLNNVKQDIKVHIECVLELYFAIQHIQGNTLTLKQMFNITPSELFERLLQLKIYDSFIKVVRPAFSQLEAHNLAESFEKYLNSYFCKHSVLNEHFPKILESSQSLPQHEHQSILETMIDCIFYSMEISHADQIQDYIEKYYLIEMNNDILRSKILRIQNILAQEELFLKIDQKLKLVEIQMGQEVMKRKIQKYLKENQKALEENKLIDAQMQVFIEELTFLRNQFYLQIEFKSLYSDVVHRALDYLTVWKYFIASLTADYFLDVEEKQKAEILKGYIIDRRNQLYNSGRPASEITAQMSKILSQFTDKQFIKIEIITLQWIQTFQSVGIADKISLAIQYQNEQTRKYFQALIDSQQFLQHEPEPKKLFVNLMYQLLPNSNLNEKLTKIRIRDLTQMCEKMLQANDYNGFLEGFSEYLGRCKEDFSLELKILWVKFIGQFIQERHWDEIGVYILKKCLYLIIDFKESMRQFFEFLNNDIGLDLLPSPEESIKLRNSYLRTKGRAWVMRRIDVIDLKIKRLIQPKFMIEFLFRHILIVDYKLAFTFLRSNLIHADIDNIYKIVVICMESQYFIHKLQIITSLIEAICKYFTMQYQKQTVGLPDTNENELLRLILKLKPNAKDEQSRNKLTFFESIITNCVNLQHFYEKVEKKAVEQAIEHEQDVSRVNIQTILLSLEFFNESMLIPKGSPNQLSPSPEEPIVIQIGETLVESSEDGGSMIK